MTPRDINRYFYAVEMGKGMGLEVKAFNTFFQINITDNIGTRCIGTATSIDSLLSFMEGYREGCYTKKD